MKKKLLLFLEGDKVTYAKWVPIEELITGKKVLYPNELTDLIKEGIEVK
ncbi:hypothetical protein ACQKCU_14410 [Heyndrickxia sporothermodurans]